MNEKLASFVKFVCIIYLIIILPKLIFDNNSRQKNISNVRLESSVMLKSLIKKSKKIAYYDYINLSKIDKKMRSSYLIVLG